MNNFFNITKLKYKRETKVDRFLIYIGSGGVIHFLNGLMYALNICIENNLILIPHLNKTGAINIDLSKFFIFNNNVRFCKDFTPIINDYFKNIKIKDLIEINENCKLTIKNIAHYYLNEHNITFLNKKELENNKINVYCGNGNSNFKNPLWNSIQINSNVKNFIENICKKYENINYLSIHYRNTDMKHDIYDFINIIKKNTTTLKKLLINNIYIASDDSNAYRQFKSLLPEFNVFKILNVKDTNNGENLHYQERNKNKILIDLFIDMYMICKSKIFIPSLKSGISHYLILNNNKKNILGIQSNFKVLHN